MNELLAWSIGSLIWGFILWAGGSFIKDILENRLIKFSGIGFFFQVIGIIFMTVPFVVATISISAFIITGFAEAISAFI